MINISLKRVVVWAGFGVALYAGIHCYKVYSHATQFDVFVKNEVKFAPTQDGTEEGPLREKIMDASREFQMTLDSGDLQIEKKYEYSQERHTLQVFATYSAVLDLSLIKYPLIFHTSAAVSY
jgi:hypothetical protein